MTVAETCQRCQRARVVLFDYPVGEKTERICGDCWQSVTGRPWAPPLDRMAKGFKGVQRKLL